MNRVSFLSVVVASLALGCASGGETPAPSSGTAVMSADGKALGTVQFPTSCEPAAQETLERALALLHHMTYGPAEASFESAAESDPECAIAYWGMAMTYVHPLWPDTVPAEKLAGGQELLERARSADHTSDRESAYIEALAGYYGVDASPRAERERLGGFLDGWARVHETYPDDPEAALFHALAQLGTAAASDKTYANQQAAGSIVAEVLAHMPSHPGAHHYLIHAYDVPPLAERALETARQYGEVAPANSHALHMTTHIFTRLGLWPESIEFNIRAADAASKRMPSGTISLHHLHAIDYLAYAHLQRADDEATLEVLHALRALEPPFQNHAATSYTFAAVPARYALERHAWEEATAVQARRPDDVAWDHYPHLEAISYFARAMGAARTGQRDEAQAAIETLRRLEEAAASLDIAYDWEIQVAIQRTAAEAWLAYEGGDTDRGLELMQQAAEMEASTEKNPVTPGEALPAMELYGDMLLAAGRYDEARQQYQATLTRSPNRFNSLYGSGRAAELAGDADAAAASYAELVESCVESGEREELIHARDYLETKGRT